MNPADRQAARDELIKTVVLSHHRLAGNASMPDGAEAVMIENAALDHYRGRHLMQMLDSFHARGLLVTNPNADLTISDGATFWNSPDLWIRNSDDGGTTHQEPEFGQDNWFYARVRNQGTTTARAFVVTFNVKPWAGTEFVYPNDFIPCISAAVGFELAPGATTVVKAKWPQALVPAVGTHACWLASVYTPTDLTPTGAHVWEHNNLAQKNLTVVDLSPNDSLVVPVQLGNLEQAGGLYRLEVSRPKRWTTLPVSLVHKDPEVVRSLFHSAQKSLLPEPPEPKVGPEPIVRFLESTSVQIAHRGLAVEPVQLTLGRDSTIGIGAKAGEPAARGAKGGFWEVQAVLGTDPEGLNAITFEPGTLVGFPVRLAPRSPVSVGLKVSVPPKAEPGEVIEVDLLQRNVEEQVVGAITIQINVVDK